MADILKLTPRKAKKLIYDALTGAGTSASNAQYDLCIAIHPLLDSRETLRQQKLTSDRMLYAMSKRNRVCRALMSEPGVGPVTSLAFLAIIDDPKRFSTSRSVGAHLGLTPRTYQSGEIDHNGHISKYGDKLMRHRGRSLGTDKERKSPESMGSEDRQESRYETAGAAVARNLSVIMHRIWLEYLKNPEAQSARCRLA